MVLHVHPGVKAFLVCKVDLMQEYSSISPGTCPPPPRDTSLVIVCMPFYGTHWGLLTSELGVQHGDPTWVTTILPCTAHRRLRLLQQTALTLVCSYQSYMDNDVLAGPSTSVIEMFIISIWVLPRSSSQSL